MNPEDLDSLAEYTSPVVRDDDVVIAISRPDLETNSYLSQLYSFSAERPVRISHGWHDSAPLLAGEWAGYLSARRGEPAQLCVGPSLEAAHRITDQHLGVNEFALDGRAGRALYVARVGERGRYGEDPDIPAAEEAPRRITASAYLSNGIGYTRDRPARAFLVDLVDPGLGRSGIEGSGVVPDSTRLATPDSDVHDPQFSPSGALTSVIADVTPDPGSPSLATTVWLLGMDAPRPIDLPRMSVKLHRWIDDETLLLVASDLTDHELDFVAQMPGLFLHSLSSGTTRRLTDPETVAVAQIPPVAITASAHSGTVDSVVAVVETDGAARVVRVPLDAEAVPATALDFVTDPVTVVTGFTVDGRDVVCTAVTATKPSVLVRTPLHGRSGSVVLQEHPAPTASVLPTVLKVEGEGGTITGWLATPAGDGPFPVVLNIHGGPFAQHTHGWFDETQVLTSAGFAVVYANPRGSGGRTRTWGRAVQGNMAEPAMADVLAVLDHALAHHSALDPTRLGVQGGSYGGFLTAMITAHDHRFRAAIVERGYLSPDSFVGTSDIGRYFTEEYTTRDRAAIDRQSPLAHAGDVRTPTLVMHSELDHRCPLEQAQQYYAALQRAGVPTELLIFPGENHELSRSGQPRHRRQRFEAILEWWQRHLAADRPEPAVDEPAETGAASIASAGAGAASSVDAGAASAESTPLPGGTLGADAIDEIDSLVSSESTGTAPQPSADR
ncbi:dipeptidyl aminopeptidase/acylaminoacyl peptidase [Brevibacterium sanguinis]|uniref:Dipeptidyl aminopeptidase/acylaminoacyl peptidase n=2 Tax=Brevibacterium TaxID=1696 RepID=A0A366IHI5_9MICO|nr:MULTISPECIES: alpha/beta fold hydrolase [Brevibacterium]RBP63922.1 dipeptidyl aminopeptidase/acylaminoacyl peptidase [Brevibacterium sanguinis]RBP70803.1 dipeptidyl aminopeptidase/acylaminoacyl peptidase [Brevibacterium celere]